MMGNSRNVAHVTKIEDWVGECEDGKRIRSNKTKKFNWAEGDKVIVEKEQEIGAIKQAQIRSVEVMKDKEKEKEKCQKR